MINKFKDYDKIQVFEGGQALEPGGYELTIIGAKVEDFPNCSILKIAFDIASGEYRNFYANRFSAAKVQNPEAKWGGVFDVFIPKDDGSELDGYTKQSFKRFTTAVEKSNPGYVWNWEESSLKGKVFGGVFGREQFRTREGDCKWTVKCRFPRSIEAIRSGDYKTPDDKYLKGSTPVQDGGSGDLSDFQPIYPNTVVPF